MQAEIGYLHDRGMRITIVLPIASMSGGTRVAAVYAEKLQQRGHQVFVVHTVRAEPPLRRKIRSWLEGRGWPGVRADEPSHLDGGTFERRILSPWRPVTDADVPDADVVIATWWETAEWVARLSPRKGAKAYFIQGYELFEGMPIERLKATWSLPMHKIVVSSWLRDIALEQYGDRSVSLVSNAVDVRQFNSPPRSKCSTPVVGMVYSDVSIKGCDISLKAFEQAAQAMPDIRLVVFGHDSPSSNLPLPERATFTLCPTPDHLKRLYASCDAWLFGSRQEGFGLPILEAMACRTPVIATPAGAAPELLKSGGGLLVRSEDPSDMGRAILQVARMSESDWLDMSNRAYQVAASYTWDDATDRFLAALGQAIERASRGELG